MTFYQKIKNESILYQASGLSEYAVYLQKRP
jgi:hypothetical protein